MLGGSLYCTPVASVMTETFYADPLEEIVQAIEMEFPQAHNHEYASTVVLIHRRAARGRLKMTASDWLVQDNLLFVNPLSSIPPSTDRNGRIEKFYQSGRERVVFVISDDERNNDEEELQQFLRERTRIPDSHHLGCIVVPKRA